MRFTRRLGILYLRVLPFLAAPLVAVRTLRVFPLDVLLGGLLCAVAAASFWTCGARREGAATEEENLLAVAAGLLLSPFALIAATWIGLGGPWEATPDENRLRYLVLLIGAIAVTAGFLLLATALHAVGERLYATLGAAAGLLAGCAYLVWLSFELGGQVVRLRTGDLPGAVVAMGSVLDVLLFFACLLTYAACAAFAGSLYRAGRLARSAAVAYVATGALAATLLTLRGLAFPDPATSPWFTRPGFIAGIPAVPWIVSHLLGVSLLRRPVRKARL